MSAKQLTAHEKFQELNSFVTKRSGWITSPPGETTVCFECLPDSTLPDDLADLGYQVTPAGEGQRILPNGITERILTECSTIEWIRHHAGIVAVVRYKAQSRS